MSIEFQKARREKRQMYRERKYSNCTRDSKKKGRIQIKKVKIRDEDWHRKRERREEREESIGRRGRGGRE